MTSSESISFEIDDIQVKDQLCSSLYTIVHQMIKKMDHYDFSEDQESLDFRLGLKLFDKTGKKIFSQSDVSVKLYTVIKRQEK